jgi:hypothetical protein
MANVVKRLSDYAIGRQTVFTPPRLLSMVKPRMEGRP